MCLNQNNNTNKTAAKNLNHENGVNDWREKNLHFFLFLQHKTKKKDSEKRNKLKNLTYLK